MKYAVITVFFFWPALLAAQEDFDKDVVIGFRSQAHPFSYKDVPNAPYEGYLAKLCYEIFENANPKYNVIEKDVDTRPGDQNRLESLRSKRIDVLCDPTTITSKGASEFLLSPIVFASGVGYLRNEADRNTDTVIGFLEGTTGKVAAKIAQRSNIIKPLEGKKIELHEPFQTHIQGVEEICKGNIEYYLGDIDIIRAALNRFRASGKDCPDVSSGRRQTFTYEPYALAVRADRADLALVLQRRLYELFSNGTARKFFVETFPEGETPMGLLGSVFSINAVFPCTGFNGPDVGSTCDLDYQIR